jgi:hypothetical protein
MLRQDALMTNYSLLLELMGAREFDRLYPDIVRDTLRDPSVFKLQLKTDVKRRVFDKGACARGGIIREPHPYGFSPPDTL